MILNRKRSRLGFRLEATGCLLLRILERDLDQRICERGERTILVVVRASVDQQDVSLDPLS